MSNYDNRIPGQGRPQNTVKNEQAVSNILEVKPGPVSNQPQASRPAQGQSGGSGGISLSPRQARQPGQSWGAWLERAGGVTGYAPMPARVMAGIGGLGIGLISGYITAMTMQPPGKNDAWLGWAVTLVFSVIELVFWYMSNNRVIMVGALIILCIDVSFNAGAFHATYQWQFDILTGKTWLYLVLGFVFAVFPEPLFKIAFKGKLGD